MENLDTVLQGLSADDLEAIAIDVLVGWEAVAPNWIDQPRQSLQAFMRLADSTRDRIRQVAPEGNNEDWASPANVEGFSDRFFGPEEQ